MTDSANIPPAPVPGQTSQEPEPPAQVPGPHGGHPAATGDAVSATETDIETDDGYQPL